MKSWPKYRSPDPLVIITSDHGESLGEHRMIGHRMVIYEQTLRVPLIVHAPWLFKDYRGKVTSRCSLLDIFPTIMTLLDHEISGLKGQSLFPVQDIAPHILFAESPGIFPFMRKKAIIKDRWKCIIPGLLMKDPYGRIDFDKPPLSDVIDRIVSTHTQPGVKLLKDRNFLRREGALQLFDLANDPAENHNLNLTQTDALSRLVPLLQEEDRKSFYHSPEILSKEAVESLKALGYIQ